MRLLDIDAAIERLQSNYNNGEGYDGSYAAEVEEALEEMYEEQGGEHFNRLNMTEDEMVAEIEFARGWDKFLRETLGDTEFALLSAAYSLQKARDVLESWGATAEQVEEVAAFLSAIAQETERIS